MIKLLEMIVTIYGDILEDELCQVKEAQFNQDFGPWKEGEEVAVLALEVVEDDVILREYDEENTIVREVKVQLGVKL